MLKVIIIDIGSTSWFELLSIECPSREVVGGVIVGEEERVVTVPMLGLGPGE